MRIIEEATAETKDFDEKIQRYVEGKFFWLPWGKLFRREFLLENKIEFPQMKYSEDMLFCFKCLCLAENYIRVPFVANIHRWRTNSQSKYITTREQGTDDFFNVTLKILEELEIFLQSIHREKNFYQLTKFFIDNHFSFIKNLFTSATIQEINKIFLQELSRPEFEKYSRGKNILLSYLCTKNFLKE